MWVNRVSIPATGRYCLATLMSSDRTKQICHVDDYIYIYVCVCVLTLPDDQDSMTHFFLRSNDGTLSKHVVCLILIGSIWVNELIESFFFIWNNCRNKCRRNYILMACQLLQENPCGGQANKMNCNIVGREFEPQSCHYVHIRANTLGKDINPIIPIAVI